MAPLREVSADVSNVDWKVNIVVVTRDNKKYALPRESVRMVRLIQDLLADAEEGQEIEMPLPEVDSEILRCIWEYLEIYKAKEPEKLERPLNDNLKNLLPDADWTYITNVLLEDGDEKKHEKLFFTLKAANFLNIEPLRDLCCATIANMLRGKNEAEILGLFGVTTPFTQEEEDKLYQEYEWLREKKE